MSKVGLKATMDSGEEPLLQVARAALAAYDLPAPLEVRPIRLVNNAVFAVVADGALRLALRIHRPGYRALEHIESELRFLQTLTDEIRGTPVELPRPVAARSGELVVCVGGQGADAALPGRYCDLLTWIDGRVLKPRRGLGVSSTRLLGEGLARLHSAAEGLHPRAYFELPTWDAQTMFSNASPFQPGRMDEFLTQEAWALFQEVATRTDAIFDQLDRMGGQRGIIHNDYILINCHFKRDARGWKLGILDFDDLGWGYFLYDLAPLLGNLSDWPDAYSRLRRAFLDGYRGVRSLPPPLGRHLPVLMAARHAVSLTWLAAKQRRGETDIPIKTQVEIRVAEMRRCLTLLPS